MLDTMTNTLRMCSQTTPRGRYHHMLQMSNLRLRGLSNMSKPTHPISHIARQSDSREQTVHQDAIYCFPEVLTLSKHNLENLQTI